VDDAGQQDGPPRGPGDVDGFGGALVGVDAAEGHDVTVWVRVGAEREGVQVDAVLDGGGVGEVGGWRSASLMAT